MFKETIASSYGATAEWIADLKIEIVNCLELIGGSAHGLAAGVQHEEAVNVLRDIPKALRADRDVDSRIEDFRKKLREAGKLTLERMAQFQSPPIDL